MISVCMATYNGSLFIKEQLASILQQLGHGDEIIISDDHSTDKTLAIAASFEDERIKIVTNTQEKGYTNNFQNSLSYAQGDYIFLTDQDDVWMPNKVKLCLELLQTYDFVVSDAKITDACGIVTGDSFYKLRKPFRSFWGNIVKFGYLGCCMAFRKKILTKALPFPENSQLCTHDNWLFLIARLFYKVKVTDDKLILYRRHSSNVSQGGFTNTTTFGFKIKYRLYLLYSLLKRIKK